MMPKSRPEPSEAPPRTGLHRWERGQKERERGQKERERGDGRDFCYVCGVVRKRVQWPGKGEIHVWVYPDKSVYHDINGSPTPRCGSPNPRPTTVEEIVAGINERRRRAQKLRKSRLCRRPSPKWPSDEEIRRQCKASARRRLEEIRASAGGLCSSFNQTTDAWGAWEG